MDFSLSRKRGVVLKQERLDAASDDGIAVTAWAEYHYQWSLGISLDGVSVTTPRFSFGGSYEYTSTKGFTVTAHSYSKGVQLFGSMNGGEPIRMNRVGTAVYGTGPAECATHYAAFPSESDAPNDVLACAVFVGTDVTD